MAGLLMEWIGRKRAVHLVSIPFLLGWLIIALSPNLFVLYIGRAITGVAIGRLYVNLFTSTVTIAK